MLILKRIGLAIAVLLSSCLIGTYSSHADAFEIIEMRPSNSNYDMYDEGSGGYHDVYVKTNEPYDFILYYLERVYVGCTPGDNVSTEAYFYFNVGTGEIKGAKRNISALAFSLADDGDGAQTFDTDSYDVRVYKRLIVDQGIKKTGVDGYVELTRHYFDGVNINVDGKVYMYNGTEKTCNVLSWFRHTQYESDAQNANPTGWKRQDPPENDLGPATSVPSGKTYTKYGSSNISFFVGRRIRKNEFIYLNPHIHLEVSTGNKSDVWHESGTMINMFSEVDNP